MPTIPTGKMELELRRLYVRWLSRLGDNTDMNAAVDRFEKQSIDLIEKMGGQTARLGALADFPTPKRLDLSPHIGTIYSDMKQAAIQAGIQAGLNASDVARHMLRAGMDKSYHRLNRLARTETVSAYWKNAWGSIEDLPELVMIWGAESGPRTCQWCLERDGMVMESSQLRDHPNGRCTPIPTLRSMVEYKGSVDAGGSIYQDPTWTKKPELASKLVEPTVANLQDISEGLASVPTLEGQDNVLQEVWRKNGTLNSLPQVVSSDIYDEMVKSGATPLYRGVNGVAGKTGPQIVDQFFNGEHYPGLGFYGNGSYTAVSKKAAERYGSTVAEMAISSDAVSISFEDLKKLQERLLDDYSKTKGAIHKALIEEVNTTESLPRLKEIQALLNNQGPDDMSVLLADPGRVASALGYDTILVDGGPDGLYHVILNRAALIRKAQ